MMRPSLPTSTANLALAAAAVLSVALGGGVALASRLDLSELAPVAVAVATIIACYRRSPTIAQPPLLLAVAFLTFGLVGYLVYPSVAAEGSIPEVLALNPISSRAALHAFVLASVGSALGGSLSRRRGTSAKVPFRLEMGSAAPALRYCLIGFSIVVCGCYIAGSEVSSLLSRATYQGFYGEYVELMRFALTFSFPCALLMCFFIVSRVVGASERLISVLVLCVLSALGVATASRELALYPLLLLIAWSASKGRFPNPLWSALSFMATTGLFSSAIVWRLGGRHGLVPYLESFFTAPWQTATAKIDTMIANLLTGFPTAAYVISSRANTLTFNDILFNLDPRPASWIGYDVAESGYTIVSYMPYGTVGMLASVGSWTTLAYFFIFGAAFSFVWNEVNGAPELAPLLNPVLMGGTFLFFLISTEYPVRQSARLGSLLLVSVLAFYILGTRMSPSALGGARKSRWFGAARAQEEVANETKISRSSDCRGVARDVDDLRQLRREGASR